MRALPTVRLRCVAAALALGLCSLALAESAADRNEECLVCHGEDEGEGILFPDSSRLSVYVPVSSWEDSVHGGLACVDCHRTILGYPHDEVDYPDRRSYQIARADTCKRCHYAYYSRVLDGIHFAQLAAGHQEAPTCVDCHGAHDTTNPRTPRVSIDRRCAQCHGEIATAYENSVHGRALMDEDNADVPVCTDCHGAHGIQDPRGPGFHVVSHEICAACHGDEERMAPYGLASNVLSTYLVDFHGSSNVLYSRGNWTPDKPLATCTDCHGIHDIQSIRGGSGIEDMREYVVTMCRRCHTNAPVSFGDAWLSHYEPSLASAPLVWVVIWAYRILIPMVMLGLVLHILLHLWRVRTARRGGSC